MADIPSTFLPHLPRSKTSLSPLSPSAILTHIAVLRELYLPPIHGGFHAADVLDDRPGDEVRGGAKREGVRREKKDRREKKRERRFSAGLVETMEGMGLGLDVDLPTPPGETIVEDKEAEEEGSTDDEDEGYGGHEETEDEQEAPHLDAFEREWAENWLSGVVRRSQGWLEENDYEGDEKPDDVKETEAILRDSTAVLAMMAGTSAAGSLTRHLVFPIAESLAPTLTSLRSSTTPNPLHSPSTSTFLASFSTSPTSPLTIHRSMASSPKHTRRTPSPATSTSSRKNKSTSNRALLPILLHDAPMSDHLAVGVQTWGSAILLGRQICLRPAEYGLFLPPTISRGPRVLELGAGTGLLSILCRKLLDLHSLAAFAHPGVVVATDFLPSVLDNLKICVDLNFPPALTAAGIETSTDISRDEGIHIAKLDWTTFPAFMASGGKEGAEKLAPFAQDGSFDLVLASDCVYDETHAGMLREVAPWVLRLPEGEGDRGGTFHILSPLRPTFAPELESIDLNFPLLSSYPPLADRQAAAVAPGASPSTIPADLRGEGLGAARGLKLGARGEGKRGERGRKGEGRIDEHGGYWWWEVGWG